MNVRIPLTSLVMLLLFLSIPFTSFAADKSILILNSYHYGYTWGDNEVNGLIDTLNRNGIFSIHVDYLDSKRFPKGEISKQAALLLSYKLKKHKPDVVITVDDPAFDFAIKNRKILFEGIPLVFCGVNDFKPEMLKGEKDIAGIVEMQDFRGSVDAALKIFPATKEIVVIHDYTESGILTRGEIAEQFASLPKTVSYRSLPELSIKEIIEIIGRLKQGSIILGVSFSRDKNGKLFNHDEISKLLSENSSVPVFSTKVERLGYGIIGGSLMEGVSHGEQAAELALKILGGASAASVGIIPKPKSSLMFDYNQLKRFNVGVNELPDGATVINKPESIYSKHRTVINVSTVIILILVISLFSVISLNKKRIAAEKAFAESSRYQELFDNANDPVVIFNAAGTIVESNTFAENTFNLSDANARKSKISDLFSSFNLDFHHIDADIPFESVVEYSSAAGLSSYFDLKFKKIKYLDSVAYLCAARDISERKIYEHEILSLNSSLEEKVKQRTASLENAISELESFSYSVSHDLQAPLRHINGFASILHDEYSDKLDDDAKNYLQRICSSAARMGQLIDDLLNLSRVSRMNMQHEPVDLGIMTEEISSEIDEHHKGSRTKWIIDRSMVCNGDKRLLKIMMTNLLDNARKYSINSVEPEIIAGSESLDGRTVYFVKDNGAGFDMQYVDKLFKPFQRLHSEKDFHGTGIGLATVKRVVQRHGGSVWAQSKVGEGATFYFTFSS